MRTINIVQGSDFRDFIHDLESRCTVPSCATIADRVVKFYGTTKDNIRKMISGEKITLTRSLATELYVTVISHFVRNGN